MAEIDGIHALGPAVGRLVVKTGRTGLGSKAGHDLTIEVTRWQGTATVDTADPANTSVEVDVEIDSFEVREGSGGFKPLTDADRVEIKKILREKVLPADRYPEISFRSTNFQGSPESFAIEGDLTIAGNARPLVVQGSLSQGRVRGGATVTQSQWGIKPYSAFFGALRLRDEVEVEFDLRLQ